MYLAAIDVTRAFRITGEAIMNLMTLFFSDCVFCFSLVVPLIKYILLTNSDAILNHFQISNHP